MTESRHVPLLIIGAGPGGYAAAFKAADLGLEVTVVDKEKNPGGVCLYTGCIPTKALLHAAKILTDTKDGAELGIEFSGPKIDFQKLNAWKDSVVDKMTNGLGLLRKMRKIDFIQGRVEFINSGAVKVTAADGSAQAITFDRAILATGSAPVHLPFAPKSDRLLDSTAALNVGTVPKTLLIIGGGYIGMEFATVYQAFGTEVTVVEMLPEIIPPADRDLAAVLQKRLDKQLKAVLLHTRVKEIKESANGLTVKMEDNDGQSRTEEFEKVLVAVGRKPVTKGLGLENTAVELDPDGFVKVDAQRRTTDPRIFAVGDIAGQPMLAHKASHEGIVAAEAVAGKKSTFDPKSIPSVVYTNPEIVWCGLTENETRGQNRRVKILKFPWAASGRAVTLNRTDGLTKLIVDADNGRVLGMGIVGENAGELIGEGVLALEMGAVADDIAKTIHPHPTLSETLMEAAENHTGLSTHVYRRHD